MDTVSQGNAGPVAVVGPDNYGAPRSFDSAGAMLLGINHVGQARTDALVNVNFIRDAIERNSIEVRAELKALNGAYGSLCGQISGFEAKLLGMEVARLRSDQEAARHQELVSAISALKSTSK